MPQVSSSAGVPAADGRHVPPHGRGGPGDLVDRLALGGQGRQEQADFVVGPLAAHDRVDGVGHLVEGEILAAGRPGPGWCRYRWTWSWIVAGRFGGP